MRYRRHCGKRYHGWVHPEFCPPSQLLEHPEEVSQLPGAELLLDCQGRQIYRISLDFQNGPQSCFTYYFRNGSFKRSLRPCYAFQSLRLSRKLASLGFGTLEVVAAIKRKGERLNWHSFVVAPEIASVCEIPSGGSHVFQIHPSTEFSPELASQLAQELARFHGEGFFHGDLKTRHLLVHTDSQPTARFYFVDLEKCHYLPHLPRFLKEILAARDLIQLLTSLPGSFTPSSDLAHQFLKRYLQASGHSFSPPSRLLKMVNLYRQDGPLSQGQTVVSGLTRRAR
ncbi:lipopolysaccharide kinase InaA family protein [Acidobacteria bacterium AH-259-D05]|nr:lipopolysaccharide kinase InaA family protein [Acidobacteria bacterium AH-259-D05]